MKLFYYLWVKGNSTWGERYTIFLCWLFHLPPTTPETTGLISASPESQLSSSDAKTQLTDFSQIAKILRARFRCMTSFTSPGHIPLWDFYFDTSEWHILPARAWTPALMLHLTNQCAKRKVLSLTKPKGKIYKTKSLSHYFTYPVLTSLGVVIFTYLVICSTGPLASSFLFSQEYTA